MFYFPFKLMKCGAVLFKLEPRPSLFFVAINLLIEFTGLIDVYLQV